MAPKGQRTYSCHWFLGLFIGFFIVVAVTLTIFKEQVVAAIQTIDVSQSAICSPAPQAQSSASMSHEHHHDMHGDHHEMHGDHHDHAHHMQNAMNKQPNVPIVYADLKILEELPKANVLWINKTDAPKPEAWGISMFHALHCIKMWKDSLNPATMMNQHVHSESEYAEHAEHCINYLIQSVVCAADSTIEPAEHIVANGKHGKRIHGMGYTHECKDTSFLMEMNGQKVQPWDWKQGDTLYSVFKK
ncbi:hypothetical protein ABW21_db0207354 [Orbilia brochopaga]|nr:hypothetical protein ABW21_db0207354 [Drechslerella brochopaga]